MRRCIRCDRLTPMEDMTHMEGVIWLHDDLDACDLNKKLQQLGEDNAWRTI